MYKSDCSCAALEEGALGATQRHVVAPNTLGPTIVGSEDNDGVGVLVRLLEGLYYLARKEIKEKIIKRIENMIRD